LTVDKGLLLQDNIMMRYRAYLEEKTAGGETEGDSE
jgi:hypothetical protein